MLFALCRVEPDQTVICPSHAELIVPGVVVLGCLVVLVRMLVQILRGKD